MISEILRLRLGTEFFFFFKYDGYIYSREFRVTLICDSEQS